MIFTCNYKGKHKHVEYVYKGSNGVSSYACFITEIGDKIPCL